MNRIQAVNAQGQSIWYDFIERRLIWTGELHRMVVEDGLAGVTSNPSIFEKAIAKSSDYTPALSHDVKQGASALEAFEELAVTDLRNACDILHPVYEKSQQRDGYVSLEVSPYLAHDAQRTFNEAKRLWEKVGRANLMMKVPATPAGITAVENLIAVGINVNVTLLFSVGVYEQIFQAYTAGLERFERMGGDLREVASVASFFVSRIDTLVDAELDQRLEKFKEPAQREKIQSLKGKIAIANAKLAYSAYQKMVEKPRWQKLEQKGAQRQRLLWASTSTKNPNYRDVIYLEELIGAETVNTVPAATYQAFKDHGEVSPRLHGDHDQAKMVMQNLAEVDVSIERVAEQLTAEGVQLFIDAYDRLLGAVEHRRREILGTKLNRIELWHEDSQKDRTKLLEDLRLRHFGDRLWQGDGHLWQQDTKAALKIRESLGWLSSVDEMLDSVDELTSLAEAFSEEEATQVVLLGMGGSSLGPEVLAEALKKQQDLRPLHVLDSTVPAQVHSVRRIAEEEDCLFIVASKSGTTIEPLAFYHYFQAQQGENGHFIAITDPGTPLETLAEEKNFLTTISGNPFIGGRFSVLSPFGMIPALAMGADALDLLETARRMVGSCEAAVPPDENAGIQLGTFLAHMATIGKDKLTIFTPADIRSLGAWLEQLIAESLGKDNRGIVPIDGENFGTADHYAPDRVFVFFRLGTGPGEERKRMDEFAAKLQAERHPCIVISLQEPSYVVQEMYRWEVAIATAGHLLGVNPFDQPNVEESKTFTMQALQRYEKSGHLPQGPDEQTVWEGESITVRTDKFNAPAFAQAKSLADVLRIHGERAEAYDYFAFNAFIAMNQTNARHLAALRHRYRDRFRRATTVGYGPRFLHSTGQLHKGGPNTGVFMQLTADDQEDLLIPEKRYSFGVLKNAQALGDLSALSQHKRRFIRVHFRGDVATGLTRLLEHAPKV